MKAGLLGAPGGLALDNVRDPERSPGDLVREARAATICSTDIGEALATAGGGSAVKVAILG